MQILSLISYVNFQIFPSPIIFILILIKVIKEAIKKFIWIDCEKANHIFTELIIRKFNRDF